MSRQLRWRRQCLSSGKSSACCSSPVGSSCSVSTPSSIRVKSYFHSGLIVSGLVCSRSRLVSMLKVSQHSEASASYQLQQNKLGLNTSKHLRHSLKPNLTYHPMPNGEREVLQSCTQNLACDGFPLGLTRCVKFDHNLGRSWRYIRLQRHAPTNHKHRNHNCNFFDGVLDPSLSEPRHRRLEPQDGRTNQSHQRGRRSDHWCGRYVPR